MTYKLTTTDLALVSRDGKSATARVTGAYDFGAFAVCRQTYWRGGSIGLEFRKHGWQVVDKATGRVFAGADLQKEAFAIARKAVAYLAAVGLTSASEVLPLKDTDPERYADISLQLRYIALGNKVTR